MKRIKCRHTNVEKKIAIIKDFAKKMGYTANVFEYNGCRGVELIGTEDSDGKPFAWRWDIEHGWEV